MPSVIRLPSPLERTIAATAMSLLHPEGRRAVDFARPLGEEALVPPDSVTWRVFKNPIALFVGGVAAVILELAEPGVRAGVWEHSSFRQNPLGRLKRTAQAAMVTVYAPRSVSQPMIAGVVRMHARVHGETSGGVRYSASDASLLGWVQATATFGFGEAYSRYVRPLSRREFDALYLEATPASRLYGAVQAPTSYAEVSALFDSMRARLEASPIVLEFLSIMRQTGVLPRVIRWMQPTLVRAAVEILPPWVRDRLGLTERDGLRLADRGLIRFAALAAERVVLKECPASQACLRLGLPANYLYA